MNTADGYDAIPYDSVAFPESHPSRLGGMARLCGFPASVPDQSRILELGCASGGNLVPMAASLPAAECVGVDFSERQIAAGQDWIKALGLGNCTLLCGDINGVSLEGKFDYIIASSIRANRLIRAGVPEKDVIYSFSNKRMPPFDKVAFQVKPVEPSRIYTWFYKSKN